MFGFTCLSCMFVANTSVMIVFAVEGEVVLAVISLLGAFITAAGVQKVLRMTAQSAKQV